MSDTHADQAVAIRATASDEFLGHPKCLFVLFFAELWERFSFYGMKALLILYMVNYLFWRQDEASHVMAWYAGLVYLTPVFGGIIADKLIGARWSVVVGGVLIAIGHFLLAFEPLPFFYSGLGFVIAGTGFLKPNISTQVGALYRSDDERRDSAFTIFYMGINLGAFIGPLLCGWLRIEYGWHYGFAAAGVGMVLGLIVYLMGMGSVVRRERSIAEEEAATRAAKQIQSENAAPQPDAAAIAAAGDSGVSQAKIYFDRSIVLVVICVFAILFWVGFEQAANVMNLWADKHTNMFVFRAAAPQAPVADPVTGLVPELDGGPGLAGWQMAPEMTQSINPFFIITLAAVFAWLWQWLERKGKQPSTPMKMAFGVFFLSMAYGIMLLAAQTENQPTSVSLAELPQGINVAEQGAVYAEPLEPDDDPIPLGATRLTWSNGELAMRGVFTDLDWMIGLGASASETYEQTIASLAKAAEERAEEVRQAKAAGTMEADAKWSVSVSVPEAAGALVPVTGWPEQEVNDKPQAIVNWDPDTRELTATAALSDRDKAQLLAAGADPEFRDALTQIYQQSSTIRVGIIWLLAFYCVLTIGELCISPVGLSLVTKAAPPAYVGLFMGIWFLTTGAVSNFLAHFAGGYWGTMTPSEYFMIFGVLGVIATVIMLLMMRVLKPMLHGVH